MVELGDELIKELNELGVPFEGLPSGAKPLSMKDYYAFDVKGRRVIFAPINCMPKDFDDEGYPICKNVLYEKKYGPRNIIPIPKN